MATSAERVEALLRELGIEDKVQRLSDTTWSLKKGSATVQIVAAPQFVVATSRVATSPPAEGRESFWLRSVIVNAARAAGVQPIDTVFSDVEDMEGLRASVLEAKGLGFDGKGCIHPRQIRVVHEAFAPELVEVEKARRIVLAFEAATAKGLGVVSLGSKMIDPPVVKRAQHTVELAIATGRLAADWRQAEEVAK